MKPMFSILALLACIPRVHGSEIFHTHTLETPNHLISITPRCPEGDVTCDKVSYQGINKKTGAALKLNGGTTVHTTCADGITPCRFIGYSFRNGKHTYFIGEDPDGEKGTLTVKKEGKVILTERGTWQ